LKKLIVIVLILAAAGGFYFWNKEHKVIDLPSIVPVASKDPFESQIVSYVPENITAITYCGAGINKIRAYWMSDGFSDLRALLTDKEKLGNFLNLLMQGAEPEARDFIIEKVMTFSKMVMDSETIKANAQVQEYVQYQSGEMIGPFAAMGLFGTLDKEVNYTKDLETIKQLGVPIAKESSGSMEVFSLDFLALMKLYIPPQAQEQLAMPEYKTFFAWKDKKFAFANDRKLVERFLNGETVTTRPALLQNAAFRGMLKTMPFDPNKDACFSFMDFKTMMLKSMKFAEDNAKKDHPDLPSVSVTDMMQNFPLTGLGLTMGYDNGLYYTQQWGLDESLIPAQVKVWMDALRTQKALSALNWIPKDSAYAVAVNGEVLKKLKDTALKQLPKAQEMEQIPQIKYLDSLEGLALAMRPAQIGSPWPEAVLVGQLKEAEVLVDLVKTQLEGILGVQFDGFKWLEKDVNGKKMSYFSTPFGVGIYMLASGANLSAASTENALTNSFSLFENNKDSLAGQLEKMNISARPAIVVAYLNFKSMLQIIRDAQGAAQMFSKATFTIPPEVDGFAKAFGEIYFTMGLEEGFVRIQMVQRPVS